MRSGGEPEEAPAGPAIEEIGDPMDVCHMVHVQYHPETKKYTGEPDECWLLDKGGRAGVIA